MEQLFHFTHGHMLSLVNLQPNRNNESSDDEDEEENEYANDFVAEDHHVGQCNMCKEQISLFHSYYYHCKDCDYSLHKFCAEMPTTLQNHPLHPGHNITLAEGYQLTDRDYLFSIEWMCGVCNIKWDKYNTFNYHCSTCEFNMDIICATMSQQKIDHPGHPHQLQRMPKQLLSRCNACGFEHKGTFYHCITCYWFLIHSECALMPSKLLIQQPTNDTFTHPHPLTLAYSFPHSEKKAKFHPRCRVCAKQFFFYFWFYKCDKCRYYTHIGCATSNYINLLRPGRGKIHKNFKDEDYPNLLRCPFPDESYNLPKHQYFINQKDFIVEENHGEMLMHFRHQHPLILLDKQMSCGDKSIFLHNPTKKVKLLCDGCVKPITTLPFYKCSQDTPKCDFVLHEWCARLPLQVQDHPHHPMHTLVLLKEVSFFGVFHCAICCLPSNGFAYGCTTCHYYVDIHCAYIPKEITHESHPGHLLSIITNISNFSERKLCSACLFYIDYAIDIAYHCRTCDFYLDAVCTLLLPKMIQHKYDKHPLSLRYNPVENHPGDYFCAICEDEVNPRKWFYHCTFCAESMHTACAPLILECEQAALSRYKTLVYHFINVKFGGTLKITSHPHLLTFVQGIKSHGRCKECYYELQYDMIFKCLECEYALHYRCARYYFAK